MLSRWAEAGLITTSQAAAIQQYEQTQTHSQNLKSKDQKNWALWGMTTIGLVAMLTGLISIIAANWDDISPAVKWFGFMALLSGNAFALWRRSETSLLREALQVIFVILILAGIGLNAQIFNIEPSGWKGLGFWLLLTFPMMLHVERRFIVDVWLIGLICCLGVIYSGDRSHSPMQLISWLTLSAMFVGAPAIVTRNTLQSRAWPFTFMQYGAFFWIVVLPLFSSAAWSTGIGRLLSAFLFGGGGVLGVAAFYRWLLLPGLLLAGAALIWRKNPQGLTAKQLRLFLYTLLSSYIFFFATMTFARFDLVTDLSEARLIFRLVGLAGLLAVWSLAALCAASLNRKRLFDILTFMIIMRVISVYLEVFGSLAATGIGLIISGAVILGLTYCWYKYRYRVVQKIEGVA